MPRRPESPIEASADGLALPWRLHPFSRPHLESVTDPTRQLALSRKDAALLTHVALAGGTPSAHLALLLWPGGDPRRALNSLRQRLHRLRRATGARLLEVAETAVLASDLALAAPPDAGDLLGAYDYADTPDFTRWLETERRSRADARRDAWAAAASTAERDGELAAALVFAQRLLVDDALSEHAHRRVMRLHYRRGDIAAAVAAFEACERTLKDELGLKPSAETLALLRTVEGSLVASGRAVVMPLPASLLRPPRTVGRDRERALLAGAQTDGRIVALVGEAGIGKTRLLQDFVATEPGAVYAQARPGDAAVTYGALARLLRAVVAAAPQVLDQALRDALARVAPEWGPTDTASVAAAPVTRLQPAVERLLAAAMAGGARQTFVVDDLHFADRASIEMLRALIDADALADARWLVAHRPIGAADDHGALLQSLADAPRACWIALSALSGADLVELLDSLALPGVDAAALGPALARHTGGNPLYVLETLRAGHASPAASALPRPHSIAHLIDRRLQRLSDRALALGRVAALAGPDFSPALAEHALATPALLLAGAWAELEAADVLRGNAFAHDLVRDGMLRATPAAIAVHAHRLLAEFLSDRGAEPATLALHWRSANEPARAAAAFRGAAQRARRAGRAREEMALLHQAAACSASAGDDLAALAAELDAIAPMLGSMGVAQALEASQHLLARAEGGPLAGRALVMRSTALTWAGHVEQAEAAGRQALAILPDADLTYRLEATRTVAQISGMRGQPGAGLALLQPWMSRLHEVADPGERALCCGAATHLLLQSDRLSEAIAMAGRHAALTRQTHDDVEQRVALINAVSAHVRRGELEQAVCRSRQAAALVVDGDQARTLTTLNETLLGYALCGLGQFGDGLTALEAGCQAIAVESPGTALHAMAEELLAQMFIRLGQRARAHRLLREDHATLADNRRANRMLLRALLTPAEPSLRAALRQVIGLAGDGPGVHVRMNAMLALARLSDGSEAVEHCDLVLQMAQPRECFPLVAEAATIRLDAWRRAGNTDRIGAALADAEHAVRNVEVSQAYWPTLMLACALAHQALGDAAASRRCRDDARAWARAALRQLPAAFQDGFRHRNATNAALGDLHC